MYLRNLEGPARTTISNRERGTPGRPTAVNRTLSSAQGGEAKPAPALPASRGAFFDMMVTAQSAQQPASAPPPRISASSATNSTARVLSTDGNSAVRGALRAVAPQVAAVRNTPTATRSTRLDASGEPAEPNAPENPPHTPVDALNSLLSKLGYDPASFEARVTSATISVPGISYEYPLLEVTVNGEKVGFHLPSAMKDPRMTAANISSMMGRPITDLSVFA